VTATPLVRNIDFASKRNILVAENRTDRIQFAIAS
jgi:hypothetical protein